MTRRIAYIAYVPVIHAGYTNFFQGIGKPKGIDTTCYVLGDDYVDEFQKRREIRAISSEQAANGLRMMLKLPVGIAAPNTLRVLKFSNEFVIANDSISRAFAKKYLIGKNVRFDTTFLRWDEANVDSSADVNYDRISKDPHDIAMIEMAREAAEQSTDWWRHVGAVFEPVESELFVANNFHVPSEFSAYIDGDPRDVIPAGQKSEINTALHCEQAGITHAAKYGISLKGARLYLTTFPCPMCAKQVAAAGITKLYFASGHASLDGESVLKSAGVELIYVKTPS